jgi:hypothetical protein
MSCYVVEADGAGIVGLVGFGELDGEDTAMIETLASLEHRCAGGRVQAGSRGG